MNYFNPTPMCDYEAATAWDAARDELLALEQLAPNWDGEGADPVKPGLIPTALRLLSLARTAQFQPPLYIYATAGGTVMIEWHHGNGQASIANVRNKGVVNFMYDEKGVPPTFEVVDIDAGECEPEATTSWDTIQNGHNNYLIAA